MVGSGERPAHSRAPAGALRHVLLLRARAWICALPITDAVETMRALPVRAIGGAPPWIRGLSIIRGAALPVIDLSALLGDTSGARGRRYVTLRVDQRQVALEVDEVLGARHIDEATLENTPPLLTAALPAPVARLGALDGQTLAMLEAAHLIPDELFRALVAQGAG